MQQTCGFSGQSWLAPVTGGCFPEEWHLGHMAQVWPALMLTNQSGQSFIQVIVHAYKKPIYCHTNYFHYGAYTRTMKLENKWWNTDEIEIRLRCLKRFCFIRSFSFPMTVSYKLIFLYIYIYIYIYISLHCPKHKLCLIQVTITINVATQHYTQVTYFITHKIWYKTSLIAYRTMSDFNNKSCHLLIKENSQWWQFT